MFPSLLPHWDSWSNIRAFAKKGLREEMQNLPQTSTLNANIAQAVRIYKMFFQLFSHSASSADIDFELNVVDCAPTLPKDHQSFRLKDEQRFVQRIMTDAQPN